MKYDFTTLTPHNSHPAHPYLENQKTSLCNVHMATMIPARVKINIHSIGTLILLFYVQLSFRKRYGTVTFETNWYKCTPSIYDWGRYSYGNKYVSLTAEH